MNADVDVMGIDVLQGWTTRRRPFAGISCARSPHWAGLGCTGLTGTDWISGDDQLWPIVTVTVTAAAAAAAAADGDCDRTAESNAARTEADRQRSDGRRRAACGERGMRLGAMKGAMAQTSNQHTRTPDAFKAAWEACRAS